MHFTSIKAGATFAMLLSAICVAPVEAAPLPSAGGDVVLTVSGAIANTNSAAVAEFALSDLEAMPHVSFKTMTPWTTGVTTFEGVSMSTLLDVVAASGGTIEAAALNDYVVSLPLKDENGADPIVAYKVNGAAIPIREKGPLWLVYPFDSDSKLQSEVYYSRAIWQLKYLTVKP